MNAATVTWAVTMILLAAAAWHQARENFRRVHGDRLDHLIDDASARFSREEGPRNLAWPPEAEKPISLVPAEHADTEHRDCGCIVHYLSGRTVLLPCILHNGSYWRQLERREGIR